MVRKRNSKQYSATRLRAVGLAIVIFSCLPTLISASDDVNDESQELTRIAIKTEIQILNSNQLYKEAESLEYLGAILKKLFPSLYQTMRVKLLKSTKATAFVLPNGSIYLSIGLLAKAQNEAQIATVLSHEAAHYLSNHVQEKRRQYEQIISDMAVYGVRGTLMALSDYSVEQEMEADTLGYDHLVSAGYDLAQAVEIMRILAAESKELHSNFSNIYKTHPNFTERIKNFTRLSRGRRGETFESEYLNHTAVVTIKFLEMSSEQFQYEDIFNVFERKSSVISGSSSAMFSLGEAHRKRAVGNDKTSAIQAYSKAIDLDPNFAKSFFGLGLVFLKEGRYVDAKNNLERFLNLEPEALEREHARQTIDKINKMRQQQ